MTRALIVADGLRTDEILTRFETAWLVGGEPDLARFVPDRRHPRRRSMLLALVRLDLENRRRSGPPRSPADYLLDYPELRGEDLSEAGNEIGSGFVPSSFGGPVGSIARLGFEPDEWSDDPVAITEKPGRSPDLVGAARSYLARQAAVGHRPSGPIDAWATEARAAWSDETVDVLVDLHRTDPTAASKLAEAVVRLPALGDTFEGFRLVGELGRGAFGRVYLASQGDLADRPVALKVSAEAMAESRTLAQLQHTNIVPIFSSPSPRQPLHALCMPYFGSTTLKDVFKDLEDQPSMPTTGRGLVETVASHREATPSSSAASKRLGSASGRIDRRRRQPARIGVPVPIRRALAGRVCSDPLTVLGRMSYVGAVLWIMARGWPTAWPTPTAGGSSTATSSRPTSS